MFETDSRIETDPETYVEDSRNELGAGMADKIDVSVFENFSSLTGGTVGASGTTLSWGHFFSASVILRNGKVPGPYFTVLHPFQWYDLASEVLPGATVTNAPMLQDAVAANFFVGNVGGVDIFVSSNVPTDATPDGTGAMFSRAAIAYDERRPFRLEPERDASRRGWELNASSVFADGTWRPTYGVQIISDITTPNG